MKYNVESIQFLSAKAVAEKLHNSGFIAYFAGGCVRDLLLGREPEDFDIATNARPEQVEALFEKTVAIGKAFGIVLVVHGQQEVEVASFRKDGLYVDGRHPESVSFATPEEDAHRRDFTMNGLFYDLHKNEIIDYVHGQTAIEQKLIKAIGNPEHRFQEDQLRLLRAIRFQAQLNFEIDVETLQAIQNKAAIVNSVSGERIYTELEKLITATNYDKALQTFVQTGLLKQLLGSEEVIWRSAHSYFRVLGQTYEERWVSFFLWMNVVLKNGASIEFYERLCMAWKFSKDLKKKTLRSVHWIFEKDVFLNYRFGELIEANFDPANERGLLLYVTFYLSPAERERFLAFEKAKDMFGGIKPEPLVAASDLTAQGSELGAQLKKAYWVQLENPLYSKEDILQGLKGET